MLPISVNIVARDEAARLSYSLPKLIELFDEVLVGVQPSADATLDVCCRLGASVLELPAVAVCEPDRFTLNLGSRNEWLLILDADEEPSHRFLAALPRLIGDAACDGYRIVRRNLIDGLPSEVEVELKYRLFRREHVVYFGGLHTDCAPEDDTRVGTVDEFVGIHHYKTAAEQRQDDERYAALRASGLVSGDTSIALRRRAER